MKVYSQVQLSCIISSDSVWRFGFTGCHWQFFGTSVLASLSRLHNICACVSKGFVCFLFSLFFYFLHHLPWFQGSKWACKSCQMEIIVDFREVETAVFFISSARFFSCYGTRSCKGCIPSDNKVWAFAPGWNTISLCWVNSSLLLFPLTYIGFLCFPSFFLYIWRNVWIPAAMLLPAPWREMLFVHTDSAVRTVR